MTTLTKGSNVGLVAAGLTGTALTVSLTWQPRAGVDADCSGLLLAEGTGKVRSDADFVFFNQPSGSGVRHTGKTVGATAVDTLTLDLAAIPTDIGTVVVAASADGGTFRDLGALSVTVADAATGATVSYALEGATTETAMALVEVYRRGGQWKVRAVGQGWASGLAGLATDFGVSVDDPEPPVPVPASPPISLEKQRVVDLEKKLVSLAKPELLSLVKTAGISLTKRGMAEHTARVVVVLDISASMHKLYRKGAVQRLVERVLALGLRFDDDGEVDVITLGKNSRSAAPMTVGTYVGYTDALLAAHPFEGATYYGRAMVAVRERQLGEAVRRTSPLSAAVPTYVLFVTDGEPSDRRDAEEQVRQSSFEPIFWQCIGIGDRFPFLSRLDDLTGRYVDNAGFFSVTEAELLGARPIADDELFDRMMGEYPGWIATAKQRGLLTP